MGADNAGSLVGTYSEKVKEIVIESIMNVENLGFEKGKFQLFGYDLIFDCNGRLWLLEVNANPACQSSRHSSLEAMADEMVI